MMQFTVIHGKQFNCSMLESTVFRRKIFSVAKVRVVGLGFGFMDFSGVLKIFYLHKYFSN